MQCVQEIYSHTLAVLVMHKVPLVYVSTAYLDGKLDARQENPVCLRSSRSFTQTVPRQKGQLTVILTRDKKNTLSVRTLAKSSVSITLDHD